jgi:MFS family permease
MNSVVRRLLPLYVSAFFAGFVLWYAVEKVFMKEIGFTDSTVFLAIGFAIAVQLALEIPAGVLADRWSRKGVLALASLALALSSVGGFLSNSPLTFLLCTGLWGVYFACNSGVKDSIIYDTLLEETKSRKGFEKYYAISQSAASTALIGGSIMGGIISQVGEPRLAFGATIPFTLLSVLSLLAFREPMLHKAAVHSTTRQHLLETFAAFRRSKYVLWLAITTGALALLNRYLFEYYQLWLIPLGISLVYFGIINGLFNMSFGVAGFIAHAARQHLIHVKVFVVAIGLSVLGLYIKQAVIVVLCLLVIIVFTAACEVLLKGRLHDELSSHQRSSVISSINTISALTFLIVTGVASVFAKYSIYWTIPILLAFVILAYLATTKIDSHYLSTE